VAAILLLSLTLALDIPDLLHRCQEADDRNAVTERNYIFQQRVVTRNGKATEIETFDTIFTGGKPYQRLIAKNDQPLSPADQKKEDSRLAKEKPDNDEQRRRKNREMAHEALKAFDFRLSGEDAEHWILDATPHPGYKPLNRETAVLKHFRGRLWISKTEFIWTRFDAEAIDDISFGLVIARISKGAHIVIERTHINNEVWLPLKITGGGTGRIALLKKLNVEFETTCSHFRKFSADSHLVTNPSEK
jgi:hypothetical protein